MVEFKVITYEQARADFLKAEMERAENRMKFWQTKIKKAKNAIAEMEAHDNASNAGWEYNFYKDALEAVKNQPKWISVEERLPELFTDVLILVKETEFYGCYKEFSKSYLCQYVAQYDDEWFTFYCHGHKYIREAEEEPNADKLEVTHWMPLPQPPKEEQE